MTSLPNFDIENLLDEKVPKKKIKPGKSINQFL